MRLLRSFLGFSVLLFATAAWAGHITGQVRFDTGQLVDNARVQLRSDLIAFQTETQTDREGKFTFDGLPLTTFHLTIEFPGITPTAASLTSACPGCRTRGSRCGRTIPETPKRCRQKARQAQWTL